MDLATSFFEEQYASPAGAAARAYVEGRGIGATVREKFRVGYAPGRWDALSSHLASKKIPPSDLESLGLCQVNERGRYDFFRDRIMLPVFDRQKRVVGFGSRLLDPDAKDRKYVNSPESALFHKKKQLYGLHAALEAIRKSDTIIVVEGNFDVLALHEAGIEEAVAPMGTALTAEQVGELRRFGKTVTVVFDGDSAGQRAAQKAVPLFVEAEVDGRVARLPAGFDPDDFVRRSDDGAATFRRMVEGARPMLEQFIQDSVEESSIEGKLATLETGRRAPGSGEEPDQARALRRAAGGCARADEPAGEARAAGGGDARPPQQPRQQRRQSLDGAGDQRRRAGAQQWTGAVRLRPEELHVTVLLRTSPRAHARTRGSARGRAADPSDAPSSLSDGRRDDHRERQVGDIDVAGRCSRRPSSRDRERSMDESLSSRPSPAGMFRKLTLRLELSASRRRDRDDCAAIAEAHSRGDEDGALRAL